MKFLTRPGRAKQQLWAVCLHESAHAMAAAYFLHVASTCKLFHKGGTCQPLRSSTAGPAGHAMYIMAGDVGASLAQFADCCEIPAGRPRFGRQRFRRRLHRLANDAKQVEKIVETSEPLRDTGIAELCKAEWEKTAETFVLCRRKLIVEIATKLYLAGRVYVPARNADDADWAMEFVLNR